MEYSKKKQLEKIVSDSFIKYLNNRVFSGCSLSVSRYCSGGFEREYFNGGCTEFSDRGKKIVNSTVFDLASLTKPLVTVLLCHQLVSEKKIKKDDTLEKFFPEIGSDKKNISIKQLLSHCSGFFAHKEYYTLFSEKLLDKRRKTVLEAILHDELAYTSGEKHVYSDLGYILLGRIVEKVSETPLQSLWKDSICAPLGLTEQLFFPDYVNGKYDFAVTGNCPWSGEKLAGKVHDDNCRFLGGVEGHAGLFGTIEGVTGICEQLLISAKGFKDEKQFFKGLIKWVKRIPGTNWSFGFDMVSSYGSSSGKYFSPESFGHLGFTGVSFWIDIERDIIIVFLTNRVLSPEDNSAIKKIRPELNDKIMKVLIDKEN